MTQISVYKKCHCILLPPDTGDRKLSQGVFFPVTRRWQYGHLCNPFNVYNMPLIPLIRHDI